MSEKTTEKQLLNSQTGVLGKPISPLVEMVSRYLKHELSEHEIKEAVAIYERKRLSIRKTVFEYQKRNMELIVCDLCGTKCCSASRWDVHVNSIKHQKRVMEKAELEKKT